MKTEERTIIKELMQGLAHAIDVTLKTECDICKGFALLVFDFNNLSGTVDYIANAEREQMIKVLKEIVMRLELKQGIPPTIGSV